MNLFYLSQTYVILVLFHDQNYYQSISNTSCCFVRKIIFIKSCDYFFFLGQFLFQFNKKEFQSTTIDSNLPGNCNHVNTAVNRRIELLFSVVLIYFSEKCPFS